jgi:cytochrome b subunit of formate dehydrogenase
MELLKIDYEENEKKIDRYLNYDREFWMSNSVCLIVSMVSCLGISLAIPSRIFVITWGVGFFILGKVGASWLDPPKN